MRDSARRLLLALAGTVTGHPSSPAVDGAPGFGLPGLTGAERPRGPWEAIATTRAPDLPVERVTFVALEDGTLVVDDDVPDGSLVPLAEAIEAELAPPYEAAAVRDTEGVWAVAAHEVLIAAAEPGEAETVELARVGGERTAKVDGADVPALSAPAGLLALLDGAEGDAALTAERLDEATWVAERWAL
ncbi:MAG: hypothetical protein M5U27_02465 [Gaiella sp.]|nr:hypothetical protein [Gaiella sp.]